MTFVRPRIVVSECLGFEPVRYNAQIINDDFVQRVAQHCDVTVVCPEVGIGLGVPRPPIRLVQPRGGTLQVVQPSTGRNVTAHMAEFADGFLGSLDGVDGFILKNRSPSCGIHDVKVWGEGEDAAPAGKGAGVFGGAVVAAFPHAAIEDEGRLRSDALRERFLTLLFALARLREVEESGKRAALVGFHAAYKYALLAHDEQGMRELGRVVAGVADRSWVESISLYRARFAEAFAEPMKLRAYVNALMHAFGHVSGQLAPAERQFFLDQVEEMRAGRVSMASARMLVQSWAVRFSSGYLEQQALFVPYPAALRK